jgi:hypothetical protein
MSDKNIATAVPKFIRISRTSDELLSSIRAHTGFSDGETIEICIALQAISLEQNVPKAKEFLYNLLVHNIATTKTAELRERLSTLRRPRGRKPK